MARHCRTTVRGSFAMDFSLGKAFKILSMEGKQEYLIQANSASISNLIMSVINMEKLDVWVVHVCVKGIGLD